MTQSIDPFYGHHHTIVMLAMACNSSENEFERDFLVWAESQAAQLTVLDLLEQCVDAVTNNMPLPWQTRAEHER